MPRAPLGFDVVRELARALPGIEESTSYGVPSLKLRGKLLACTAINKSAEPGSLGVRVGIEERARLIAEDPDVYYVTDHYVNYPMVLVRLSRIHRDSLHGLLVTAYQFVSGESNPRRRGARNRGPSNGRRPA